MDNNAAERALKYPILGRKAWLFFGNQTAGETAAKLFTLTKTCNRHRIDPFAYLQDVYARLPTTSPEELPLLLPDRWIEDHPQHLIQQRVQEALDRAQRTRERRAERRGGMTCPLMTELARMGHVKSSSNCCRTSVPRCSSGTSTPEVRDQLKACASSADVETITLSRDRY